MSNPNISAAENYVRMAKQELASALDALNDNFDGESFGVIASVIAKLAQEASQLAEAVHYLSVQ